MTKASDEYTENWASSKCFNLDVTYSDRFWVKIKHMTSPDYLGLGKCDCLYVQRGKRTGNMGELMDIQQTVNDSATSSDLISATVNQSQS